METEIFPVCPHCDAEIKGIRWLHEDLANIRIFICPECKKILSIQEWYGISTSEVVVSKIQPQAELI